MTLADRSEPSAAFANGHLPGRAARVEALIAEPSVKTLDEHVLHGFARADKIQCDAIGSSDVGMLSMMSCLRGASHEFVRNLREEISIALRIHPVRPRH